MNGAQLKHIRLTRGLNLREMADLIGDISHTTVMRWGNDPHTEVPDRVTEKLFRTLPVTLPLEDLHSLLELAREDKLSFQQIITGAFKAYLTAKNPAPADNILPLPLPAESAKVAEDPTPYKTGPPGSAEI
jgi:transcriptional regulator with XRE-family HTH domain